MLDKVNQVEEAFEVPDNLKFPKERNQDAVDKLRGVWMSLRQQLDSERLSFHELPFINDQGVVGLGSGDLPVSPSKCVGEIASTPASLTFDQMRPSQQSGHMELNELDDSTMAIETVQATFTTDSADYTDSESDDVYESEKEIMKCVEPIVRPKLSNVIYIERPIKQHQKEVNDVMIASKSGHANKALAQLDSMLSKQPCNEIALIERGRLIQHDQPWTAVEDLEKVIRLNPANRLAKADLLQTLLFVGRIFLIERKCLEAEKALHKLRIHGFNDEIVDWFHSEIDAAREFMI